MNKNISKIVLATIGLIAIFIAGGTYIAHQTNQPGKELVTSEVSPVLPSTLKTPTPPAQERAENLSGTLTTSEINSTSSSLVRDETANSFDAVKYLLDCSESSFAMSPVEATNYLSLYVCNDTYNVVLVHIPVKTNGSTATSTIGLISYSHDKCACHDDIGYIDASEIKAGSNGEYNVSSGSIVLFRRDFPVLSKEASIDGADGLSSLVAYSQNGVFRINPLSKEITRIYTAKPMEDLYGQDLWGGNIIQKVLDDNTFEINIWDTEEPIWTVKRKILDLRLANN